MACECETYIVRCVGVNVCNVGTLIGIVADEDSTWLGRVEFNGAYTEFGISVSDGEEIAILTMLLNESYVHELKLYREDGELFNCYKLYTSYTRSIAGAPVPPVAVGAWDWHSVTASGNTVTSDYFTGELSPIIWLDSNPIEWASVGITQDPETGELDLTAIGGYVGTVSFQYRNLSV